MTGVQPEGALPEAATLSGGVALLERAVGYTLGQLHVVTTADLSRPTPCAEWDVRGLLLHLDDSLAALAEAIVVGHVDPPGPVYGPADSAVALVGVLRGRACRLLGALAEAGDDLVLVGGFPVPASVVTSAGAIDVAVHGWDVARACGRARPIPAQLAGDMLEIARLLVGADDRPERFAAPVPMPREACASDRLVGYLGRNPG